MRAAHPHWSHAHPLAGFLCDRHYDSIKRAADVLLCVGLLPLALPLLAVIAVVICLDSPGGPFYVQRRTGQGGRSFGMYKFRTMRRDAEELKRVYAHLNELTWPDFKIKNDPRITRVGRVLRKTSLDELPQIVNVLKGDMSLVGPRPTSFGPQTYGLWHTQRLDAKPGITGLWQVEGRGAMQFDARTRLEIQYVQRPCLLQDFALLVRTFTSVLGGKGAY
jgi:lipopolysaccharide/colanic/teichoic acid biosynthesis glycosyltransferase